MVLLVLNVNFIWFFKTNLVFFRTKLTIYFISDCGICMVSISNKRFRIMFWTPHENNSSFLNNICDFIFSAPFTWLAQHNKQEINHTQKTQKEQTWRYTRMLKKTITISTINRHILQKKKILQTDIHKYISNFQNSKSDKEYEQWVIYCKTPLVKIVIFIVIFMCLSDDLHFYYDL